MTNTIAEICEKYQGYSLHVQNLPAKSEAIVRESLKIPEGEEIVAFFNAGKFASGIAICESGIHWRNASGKPSTGHLAWQEMSVSSFGRKGMLDVTIGNEGFVETGGLINPKELIGLLEELKQAVIADPALFPAPAIPDAKPEMPEPKMPGQKMPEPVPAASFEAIESIEAFEPIEAYTGSEAGLEPGAPKQAPAPPPASPAFNFTFTYPMPAPPTERHDYSKLFYAVTGQIQSMMAKGRLGKMPEFYSIGGPGGRGIKELDEAYFFLRTPGNADSVDDFMAFLHGQTKVLATSEFPVFGYGSGFFKQASSGWVCTNKRIYRSHGLFFKKEPIDLLRVKKFKAKEAESSMELKYGFLNGSDSIDFPYAKNGFFSRKFDDIFNELVAIFECLIRLRLELDS